MTDTVFEPTLLPDSIKEDLCRGLIEQVGGSVTRVRSADGELNMRCVMPWHPERKPSASLNYKKLTYRCLGCGAAGGILWFIAVTQRLDGNEARTWLETKTGFGEGEIDLSSLLTVIDAVYAGNRREPVTPIPRFSTKVLEPWRLIHPWLTDPVNYESPSEGGRGIPPENLINLQWGFDPEHEVTDERGRKVRSPRIIIPHFWRGNLVGWQSRRLADDGTAKYLATVDFPRQQTIYNHDPSRRVAVVVESPASVARHIHHLPMCATFGSVITDRQIQHLAEYEKVIYWPDPDEAGWKSVDGFNDEVTGENIPGIERLVPYTDVRVVESQWAADPAEIWDDEAERLVADAVPFPIWQRPTGALRCLVCRNEHGGACAA